jgi:large subunit ribosomal protein L1
MAKDAKKVTEDKELKEAELVVETAPIVEEQTTFVETQDEEKPAEEKATAKAGKRSAKSLKEVEEKEAKEERKAHAKEETIEAEVKPKKAVKPTRSRLERRGKKFRDAAKLIETGKVYGLNEAVELAKKTNPAKFDASVELHINLNVDPRHADQNIRDNLVLPAGSGKAVRIAVFDDEKVAGADISGVEAVTSLLEKGELNFDVLIATPTQMPKLGKYARILGPRGLMPNPKSGTVTPDVAKAVKEAKAGRVEYRVDGTGIVHLAIGKVSFTQKALLENAQAVLASIKANKPASIKGIYVKSVHVTTTMGPSISIDPNAS